MKEKNRIVNKMEGVTISKCGARFIGKKEVEFVYKKDEPYISTIEKPIQKKTTGRWTKKKVPEIEVGDFANLENEK
jgi:hypothetical protein